MQQGNQVGSWVLEGGAESRSPRPASPRFYLSDSSKLEVGNPKPLSPPGVPALGAAKLVPG